VAAGALSLELGLLATTNALWQGALIMMAAGVSNAL
jgi:hypothetical protein